jgi:hypothetical protein
MQSMQGKCLRTKPKHKAQFPKNPRNFSPIGIHCQNGRKFLEGQYNESPSIKCANSKTKAWRKSNYIEDQRLQTKKDDMMVKIPTNEESNLKIQKANQIKIL